MLKKVVALSSFIPLLIGTGGNVGAQSSTVVIRSLNVDQPQANHPLWVIQREALAGAILGLMLGGIVIIWAYFLQGSLAVAIAVGISLIAISILASVAGSALPFVFRAIGFAGLGSDSGQSSQSVADGAGRVPPAPGRTFDGNHVGRHRQTCERS